MKSILGGLVALAMSASATFADYQAGDFNAVQTRFGPLQVVGDRGSQRVLINGADLGVTNHAFSIDGVWAVEGGAQDWAVLKSYHGGNMCGGFELIAVMLSAQTVTRTGHFGICRGAPVAIRVMPDAMELDVSDPSAQIAHQTFRFDGTQLTQTPSAAQRAAPAGAGASVTRWLGRHPQNLIQDPGEHARFAAIMTPAQMDDMARRMSGPGATQQNGDWIVGRACQAHQCNRSSAVWAIRISDGSPMAIFFDNTQGSEFPDAQVFGTDLPYSDPVIRSLLEETLP